MAKASTRKWLTNIDRNAPALCRPGQSQADAEHEQREWLLEKEFGPPLATKAYSTAELEVMGMTGVYAVIGA
jgi:hypothetical protein